MSFDEAVLEKILRACHQVRLEVIVIGNAGAVLQDVPVMTHDVDFFVRNTPLNHRKITRLAGLLGGVVTEPYDPVSTMKRVTTPDFAVDFVFRLSSDRRFESIRSRSKTVAVGKAVARVASLKDIIEAKEAAGRPKDQAVLPVLRNALRIQQAVKKANGLS
jgi:hypothetical protein